MPLKNPFSIQLGDFPVRHDSNQKYRGQFLTHDIIKIRKKFLSCAGDAINKFIKILKY